MPRGWIVGTALLVACQQTVRLESAPEGLLHARAYLWIELRDGGVHSVHATRTLEPIVLSEGSELHVLTYDCGLAGLYIPEGALSITTGSQGRPLPVPRAVYRAEPIEGGAARWVEEVVPPYLRGLRLAVDASPCPRFESHLLTLEGSHSTIAMALSVGPEEVLAATFEGRFYSVGANVATPLTEVATTTPNRAAVLTPAGEVLILGAGGHLVRGPPRGPFVDAGDVPWPVPTRDRAALAADEIDGVLHLYAVSTLGAFAVHDGVRWSIVDDGHLHAADEPGVARLPNGEVYAIGPRPGQVLRWVDGSVSYESVNAIDELQSDLIYAPLLGLVLGTTTGQHFLRGPDGLWSELPGDSPVGLEYTFQPFRAGLLIGGINGFITHYDPIAGYCPPEQLGSNGITHIAPVADGWLLLGLWQAEAMGEQAATGAFVRPIDPAPDCGD